LAQGRRGVPRLAILIDALKTVKFSAAVPRPLLNRPC